MARDAKDVQTVDAFPVKKRGRPSTGSARTAAERMRDKRDRDRIAINRARTATDYAQLSTPALLHALGEAVAAGIPKSARLIAATLVERSKQV